MIKSIQNMCKPLINGLCPSEATKTKMQNFAKDVASFVNKHKGLLFFGATVLFTAVAPPAALAEIAVVKVIAAGALTACALQLLAVLYGSQGLASKESDEKISFLLGSINICTWYLVPEAALATGIFNAAVKGCSLAFRHCFEIK